MMIEYVREIKKQFRDKYGFEPFRYDGDEPCFECIPDGIYPMTIEGRVDRVAVTDGTISCCNFDEQGQPHD